MKKRLTFRQYMYWNPLKLRRVGYGRDAFTYRAARRMAWKAEQKHHKT